MDTGKNINDKLQMLFKLSNSTQREFAKRADVSATTVNEYFSHNRNITIKNFLKILFGLGINLELLVDSMIKSRINENPKAASQEDEDIVHIINGLDPKHRSALLNNAINLYKLKKPKESNHIIERVKRTLN